MHHVLLLGAGRSSVYLIDYLIEQAALGIWQVTIADLQTNHLEHLLLKCPALNLVNLNIKDQQQLQTQVQRSNVVISLLPAGFHFLVAQTCLEYGKHFLTASYVSPEIQALQDKVKEKGLLFLMEMGLDPGIDHLSALAIIAKIRSRGGELQSFKSYTGGLVAPSSDDNPWHYKISWNPRNVVLAGQGTARYLYNHTPKYIPYAQLFQRTEKITIPGVGILEGYANRDSLLYRSAYGLETIPTMLRGTLRWPGYCAAWQQLIKLGLTEDNFTILHSEDLTYRQLLESYLPPITNSETSLPARLAAYLEIPESSDKMQALHYLGLWSEESIGLLNATPAQILEQLLVNKLKLHPTDKDLVIMQHEFEYVLGNERRLLKSTLTVEGQDATYTAMAKTVGLPLGLAAKLLIDNAISLRGIHIPTSPELYEPILTSLETMGIQFTEHEEVIYKFK